MSPLCSRCGTQQACFRGYPSGEELQAAARPEDTGHRINAEGNMSYFIRIRPDQIELLCERCRPAFEAEAEGRSVRPLAPEA